MGLLGKALHCGGIQTSLDGATGRARHLDGLCSHCPWGCCMCHVLTFQVSRPHRSMCCLDVDTLFMFPGMKGCIPEDPIEWRMLTNTALRVTWSIWRSWMRYWILSRQLSWIACFSHRWPPVFSLDILLKSFKYLIVWLAVEWSSRDTPFCVYDPLCAHL